MPSYRTALEMARDACARCADAPLIHYRGTTLTGSDVAVASDAFACQLGVARGDRVALYLQNVPEFAIGAIAAWKLGAIVVPVNPMLRERELAALLDDCDARVLVCADELAERAPSRRTVTVSEFSAHAGERPHPVDVAPDDVACLVYTSGTTGPPKGAMNLHRNVAFTSMVWRDVPQLGPEDVNLVLAPLFHVTGLIAGLGASLAGAFPMVLGARFDPAEALEQVRTHRPTFTVAAITAFQALMRAPGFADVDWSPLRAAYTGGAPVAPAVADAWFEATGVRLHHAYGLTETTSPLTASPLGADTPVDPGTGALAVGRAVSDTRIEVLGDDGAPLPAREVGEIVAAGPQVVPGYWNKPEESEHAIPDGRLRTGDVGFLDEDGWLYLVDRRKDMIIASGYKVWPREVEDVLYAHPAVREAAVVGVPDSYRGETVKAVVSLKDGARATPDELIAHCRERMAAYKYPRQVEIVDELPKTITGKIMRRALR